MYESKTYDVVLADLLSRVPNTVDKREGSVIYDALAPCAAEIASFYAALDEIITETYVDTASLEGLILRAKERGIEYREAEAAQVIAEITVSNGEIKSGDRFFLADSGIAYTWDGTTSDDGSEYILIAEEMGTSSNISEGSLIYDGTAATVTRAVITDLQYPGRDAETADELRARYYADIGASPFGGNMADYREKALLISGVGGVQVRRAWDGAGTVKLLVVSSEYSVPSEDVINSVQDYFDPLDGEGAHTGAGMAPIGVEVTAAAPTATSVSISASVTLESGVQISDIETAAETAIREYLRDCVETWAQEGVCYVRLGRIFALLSALDGVVEPSDVAINGDSQTLVFDAEAIPVFESLTITEAST